MAIHISRDFSQIVNTGAQSDMVIVYTLAIFLRNVLNFTIVGQTNMDIDGTYLRSSGTEASINLGTGVEWWVEIPTAQYVVSQADNNCILVLRSAANPRKNSGLFRITKVDATNNRLQIDYRSSGYPPAESNALPWAIYESEDSVTYFNGGNSQSGEYQTRTTANASRIILQSPHSSGWQVRITRESNDSQGDIGGISTTITPGTGGDSLGDFQVGGEHLHNQLYYNDNTVRGGLTVGIGMSDNDDGTRWYFWGDDQSGSCVIIGRDAGCGVNGWCLFGLPEDEPTSLPDLVVQRLFSIGDDNVLQIEQNWTSGPTDTNDNHGGCAFGLNLTPVSCIMSTYTRLVGAQQSSSDTYTMRGQLNAADNPLTNRTELQTVDLIAGTWDNMTEGATGSGQIALNCRRLGRVPIARLGRNNFGRYALSTDSSWFHIFNGIWLPWEGPKPLP